MPLWSENRRRQSLSRSNDSLRFRHRPYAFDTSSVVPLQSSSCQTPDLVLPRPFPSMLTTTAFDHSRRRWFGTRSCQPVPRGRPSSIKQLHTLGPPRPFALVAHSHPHTGSSYASSDPTPYPDHPDKCSPAAQTAARLAACPPHWPPPSRPPSLPAAGISRLTATPSCPGSLPRSGPSGRRDWHGRRIW